MRLAIFFVILSPFLSFSQSGLVAKAFVTKDTVMLKVVPTSPEVMKLVMQKGLEVKRMEWKHTISPQESDFSTMEAMDLTPPLTLLKNGKLQHSEEAQAIVDGIVNAENEDQRAFIFSLGVLRAGYDADVATLLNQRIADPIVSMNAKVAYLIRIKGEKEHRVILEVDTRKKDSHTDFETLKGEVFQTSAVLSWDVRVLEDANSAYWVERSEDRKDFTPLNAMPYVHLVGQDEKKDKPAFYWDTLVEEGQTYFYRIRAIDHFCQLGGKSNVVEVYIPNRLDASVWVDSVFSESDERRVVLGSVNFKDSRKAKYLEEVQLYRSDSARFGFELLDTYKGSDTLVQFTVEYPARGERYYYKLAAISQDGDTTWSLPQYYFTYDNIPPHIPEGLQGTIDSSGLVRLSWTENTDHDMRGYRVFRANALYEEFVEVTRDFATSPIYVDTIGLKNLTPSIYYQVVAVDQNFNNSKPCEPVKLKKPDIIPPVQAILKSYKVLPEGVELRWQQSTSEDVAGHTLLRKYSDSAKWETLETWLAQDTSSWMIDSTVIEGTSISYRILVSDEAGNETDSKLLHVNYEPGVRKAVKALEATVDRTDRTITLSWQYNLDQVYSYSIYRKKEDGRFILLKTVHQPESNSYVDDQLQVNNLYHYMVKATLRSGVSSKMSEEVEVMF